MTENLELKQSPAQKEKKVSQDLSTSSLPLKEQVTTSKKDLHLNKKVEENITKPTEEIFGDSETILDQTINFIADRLNDLDHAIFQPRSKKQKEEQALDEFQEMQLNAQHVKRVFELTKQKEEEEEEELEVEEKEKQFTQTEPQDATKKEKAATTTEQSSSQPYLKSPKRRIRL